jgi:ABC-type amino acid transport substrate-binding protein
MNFGVRFLLALALAMVLAANPCAAGEKTPPRSTLVVGTKEAPPFSMKDADGAWTGISIDLMRKIAEVRASTSADRSGGYGTPLLTGRSGENRASQRISPLPKPS